MKVAALLLAGIELAMPASDNTRQIMKGVGDVYGACVGVKIRQFYVASEPVETIARGAVAACNPVLETVKRTCLTLTHEQTTLCDHAAADLRRGMLDAAIAIVLEKRANGDGEISR